MAERLRDSSERLPWLTEVPKPAPPAERPAARRSVPLLAFLLGALFALIGAGAYWLGTRQAATETAEAERPGMVAQAETAAEAEADAAAQPLPLDTAPPEAPVPTRRADIGTRPQLLPPEPQPPTVQPARSQPRRAVNRQRTVSRASAPVIPVQPVVRGRIIQTGAFPSRAAAEAAWRQMVTRWPYLATKPRLIAPLEVRSTDGKATRMFRVQLATASQAQSEVICQRLQTARQSCVVVY